MPTTDSNGIVQFINTDSVQPLASVFNTLGSSVSTALTGIKANSVYKATSLANANTVRTQLASIGVVGTTSNPLLFFRTDEQQLYTWGGSSWAQIGGVPFATFDTTSANRSVTNSTWTALATSSTAQAEAQGVSSSSGRFTITQPGVYLISGWIKFDSFSGRMGAALSINGNLGSYREKVVANTNIGAVSIDIPTQHIRLAEGGTIAARAFQQSGGTRTINAYGLSCNWVRP